MNKKFNSELPVVVSYARTAIGDFLGGLSALSAVELGTAAAKATLEKAGVAPAQVDEVVCGMVYKAGAKGNPARQIQLALGCPESATASTVDQQCASGMRAFEMACRSILLGESQAVLVIGCESMSNVPYLMSGARTGLRMGNSTVEDEILKGGLHDAMLGYHMGVTAENLAEKYNITRQEQDELALLSHQRAAAAWKEGRFSEEIAPVEIATRKGSVVVDKDEHPRDSLTMEGLQKLRPAFKKDGTVTAGNASGVNDGAASLLLMSAQKARELGLKPIAEVLATAAVGVAPEIMGIGPAYAIPKALKEAELSPEDVDYYEINEAFAAQFLAVNRELKLSMDKVNLNGSGIALGHPVGCTGARIILAALQELRRQNKKIGVASLCVGGGPAMATVLRLC